MKTISNIVALLIIVGIVIALAVTVSNLVLSQISKTAQRPRHVQVTGKDVIRLGANSLDVKITFYNPSNLEFTICPVSVMLFTNGFASQTSLTLVERPCIKILPGESGKLEVVVTSQNTIYRGVLYVRYLVSSAGGSYYDLVLIPLK